MSIFWKCCGESKSNDSNVLNQSNEVYCKAESNLNNEREEENQEIVEEVLVAKVYFNIFLILFKVIVIDSYLIEKFYQWIYPSGTF